MKYIFFVISLALLLASCGEPHLLKQTIRTDEEPIVSRLPKLGHPKSVWWTFIDLTKDSLLSPPAHPMYRVYGFAQLEQDKVKEISEHYEWQKAPSNWRPELIITNLDMNSLEWSWCNSFTTDFKPPLIAGKLFLERQKGIVYFDIAVEK